MGTVDFLNAPMLKNAGLDNTERPAADFFGRLKNADDAAFETRALFVQIAQRPQKPQRDRRDRRRGSAFLSDFSMDLPNCQASEAHQCRRAAPLLLQVPHH